MKKVSISLVLALVGGTIQAQDMGPIKLLLKANGPPVPALRFALLPELRNQVPGNAAPLYRRAGDLLEKIPAIPKERTAFQELVSQWIAMPFQQLPRDEVRKALAQVKEPLDLLEKAARAEMCDLELAQRLRENGIRTTFPELQQMRNASQVLSVKARLELADDRPDLALRTLRCHFVLAKRLGETPTLIGHLVGLAVTGQACNVLEAVITHPQAPNLAWSLFSLPQPFHDIRKAFEGERLGAYGTFPGALEVANDLNAGPLPPDQLEKIVKACMILDGMQQANIAERFLIGQHILDKHEIAKKALISAGRPREKVEQWPHVQVALMHALAEYDKGLDEMMKIQVLPCWQAAPLMEDIDRRGRASRNRGPTDPALPLAPLWLPAAHKIILMRHRMERQFAALRCLEAIRLYPAKHQGHLPETLADVKEVPIPLCPVTGQPFEYRRTRDDTAQLTAPPVLFGRGTIKPMSYELTLRR